VVAKAKPKNSRTFDYILSEGVRKGLAPAKTQEARNWFRQKAKSTLATPSSLIREDRERLQTQIKIGEMYHFFYDPKHKKELPYYDSFPLIFKIEEYSDRFLGINLHYLPLPLRAKLMDALYSLSTNTRYDEKTKLKISYQILKAASKYKWFKPCIKMYLKSHVKSRFMKVYATEWDIALFLPTESFNKASKQKVWRDSRESV
jgi:hypothetical protein